MQKQLTTIAAVAALLLTTALSAQAQQPRTDAVWARSTAGAPITMDGVLDEPAWAMAESIRVQYQENVALIPGSGWVLERGVEPNDPTDALIKFLVVDNWLYLGIALKDSSVGGGLFNQFDGLLMNMRDRSTPERPTPPFEYFYGWVTEGWADPATGEIGADPGFFGWAGGPRDSLNSQIWNAATTVQGLTNADSILDEGWVTEICFNLETRGYDAMQPGGDVISFNMSIYDADWQWPLNEEKFSGNRAWLQGPWGNSDALSVLRIHVSPDVTIDSGNAPKIEPDVVVANGSDYDDPVIDGKLDDAVWQNVTGFDVRFDDDDLRNSYPGAGPDRSGQFQPEIDGVRAAVLDPADVTIKWYFKGDMLYLGADVRDQAVWSLENFDQWDGVRFTINDRELTDPDGAQMRRDLDLRFGTDGAAIPSGYLATLTADTVQGAEAAVWIKQNTTINDFNDVDEGFQAEIAVDLTHLGYPSGLGDGLLFISATVFDGDSFVNDADNYGNRAWFFRESGGRTAPAWGYMDPFTFVPGAAPVRALERPDAIWARTTTEEIVLDGELNESAWQTAEAVRIQYGRNEDLIPGSGYFHERGVVPSDPTDATLKFLVNGNNLYLAIEAKDQSVGGGLFNQFDGFLMNMRNHDSPDRPAPPFEYFYGWVTEGWADPATGEVGADPGFFGWAGGPRDSVTSRIWNAATKVNGLTNADSVLDDGYVTELWFNLEERGYDVTRPEGDIVEFNISIYDADWQWPLDNDRFSGNRTWWQGPWGNNSAYSLVRIYARPDVTDMSGDVPKIGAEVVIPNGRDSETPVIDGVLDEPVWALLEGFDLRFDDEDLRNGYSGVGPYRSGQFQPEIEGARAAVLDPGDATFKWFFKENMLYIGVDVRDQAVWSVENFDQWDGVQFIINDRSARDDVQHNLLRREMSMRFDPDGRLITGGFLTFLQDSLLGAESAVFIKPNTTINNFDDVDEGFSFELVIDLTHLGYPVEDNVLFISAALYDGDSFENAADNYGNRTWYFRERPDDATPAYALLDQTLIVSVESDNDGGVPKAFTLLGNYPNPFNPSTNIAFTMPEPGNVTLTVYDILGRVMSEIDLGERTEGRHTALFKADRLSSGVYFYRLKMETARGAERYSTLYGKMMILK